MNNEYKTIPFSEVAVNQPFEDAGTNDYLSTNPWIKVSDHKYKDDRSEWELGCFDFTKGCLVRTADCEPVPESSVEGVLKSIVIAMMDIQVNAADTLWINSSETVFERLWDIYTLHGGDEAVLKEAFPLYA